MIYTKGHHIFIPIKELSKFNLNIDYLAPFMEFCKELGCDIPQWDFKSPVYLQKFMHQGYMSIQDTNNRIRNKPLSFILTKYFDILIDKKIGTILIIPNTVFGYWLYYTFISNPHNIDNYYM